MEQSLFLTWVCSTAVFTEGVKLKTLRCVGFSVLFYRTAIGLQARKEILTIYFLYSAFYVLYACNCKVINWNRQQKKRSICFQSKDNYWPVKTPTSKKAEESIWNSIRGSQVNTIRDPSNCITPQLVSVFFWWSQVSRSSFNNRLDLIRFCWRCRVRHTRKACGSALNALVLTARVASGQACPWLQ